MKNKFGAVKADLQNTTRADKAIEISNQNREEIESLKFRLAKQDRKVHVLATEIAANILPNTTSEIAAYFIERAYCITSTTKREEPPYLVAKSILFLMLLSLSKKLANILNLGSLQIFINQLQ